MIRSLTEEGVGVILITDELLELIGLSNRILIMQHGQITAQVDAPVDHKPRERDLIALMLDTNNANNMKTYSATRAVH